jgi:hypothetical protein
VSRLDFSRLPRTASTRAFLHDACHTMARSFLGLVISQLIPRIDAWDRDLAFMILTTITGSSARMFGRVSLVGAFVRRFTQSSIFHVPPRLVVSPDFLIDDDSRTTTTHDLLLTNLLATHVHIHNHHQEQQ